MLMALTLHSGAFAEGGAIPRLYTCEGRDISPPLSWTGAPQATASFALVVSDADAPGGTWYHWAVFDLDAEIRELPEAYLRDARIGTTRQAITDFGRSGYGGPCPPKGHGRHHYRFHLMALNVAPLDVEEGCGCRDVEQAAKPHVLAETVLTGTYAR
jgi:hypothetical protein